MAVNRFSYPQNGGDRGEHFAHDVKCCFISYQNSDSEQAKIIADYLLNGGIDIYFDQYDRDLRIANQDNNPKDVVRSLCNGINASSHMLVVVSPTTMTSKWVPFEIGFGYEKTSISVLCLKNILVGSLPEYIRTAHIVRDIYDLNKYVERLTNQNLDTLQVKNQVKAYNAVDNPLSGVMDKLINDNYK